MVITMMIIFNIIDLCKNSCLFNLITLFTSTKVYIIISIIEKKLSGDKNKPGETSRKTIAPQKPLFVLSACPPHNLKTEDYTWIPLA